MNRFSLKYILPLLFVLIWISPAWTQTVAVYPVEDLSKGRNGINFELTEVLAERLQESGFDIVPSQEILSFMSRNRIRWVGFLESKLILQAKEELNTDFILFGTICQQRNDELPALGLSLNMVRTTDAASVWSNTNGISRADEQRILGISEPSSTDELLPIIIDTILAGMAEDLNDPSEVYADIDRFKIASLLDMESAIIEPKYVRPGESVNCTIRLRPAEEGKSPQIFIKAGNRVHIAMESSDGRYYQASWTGANKKPTILSRIGNSLKLAMKPSEDSGSRILKSIWTGAGEDERYPVSLILIWPNGNQQETYLGAYTVDSTPPGIGIKLLGKEFQGKTLFNRKLRIKPILHTREPITSWEISVEKGPGEIINTESGKGSLPRLVWNGSNTTGHVADDGEYTIFLTVQDRAGNVATASEKVTFIGSAPPVSLDVTEEDNTMKIVLDSESNAPINHWRLDLLSETGELLKQIEGEELPYNIDYTPPETGLEKAFVIEGNVLLRDILGNKTKKRFKDLLQLARNKAAEAEAGGSEIKTESPAETWDSDF